LCINAPRSSRHPVNFLGRGIAQKRNVGKKTLNGNFGIGGQCLGGVVWLFGLDNNIVSRFWKALCLIAA
jgi:hypothetical protein